MTEDQFIIDTLIAALVAKGLDLWTQPFTVAGHTIKHRPVFRGPVRVRDNWRVHRKNFPTCEAAIRECLRLGWEGRNL